MLQGSWKAKILTCPQDKWFSKVTCPPEYLLVLKKISNVIYKQKIDTWNKAFLSYVFIININLFIWIWMSYADRASNWHRVSGTGGAQANPYLGSFWRLLVFERWWWPGLNYSIQLLFWGRSYFVSVVSLMAELDSICCLVLSAYLWCCLSHGFQII